ncbi:23S rRNA (pseudouridine(1915)-N(3))-methyltransferase RlmH [Pedobacter yulinensis]|uniref:Ribosomal RNA large subunit methyltransferase H n=1 Tax=Pedobacter yulinensis TaxID=2126353 RepID=A0A2T3HGR7_9SPHI|nr:23S rRNA (pseudouridine(1915)-N(3))-methyltransferase RlmH [Pedobacter yulinensis]PST81622.1 23S rRNA (pseudouridine(1915)-N(3))-methyltransferase RlmH [Pedobacter yulinensis]
MKIKLIVIGKTEEPWLHEGIEKYLSRLKHYVGFSLQVIPDIKNTKHLSEPQQKSKEAELLLKQLSGNDVVILMDERGKKHSSVGFSQLLNRYMVAGTGSLVFVIGGPYGFAEDVYKRANALLSLSEMTFSHQMIRLFFTEQLYRAFTIMRNEPYHHA